MKPPRPVRLLAVLGGGLALVTLSCGPAPHTVSFRTLTQDAQAPVATTYNPRTGRPSFIRGRIPIGVFGLLPADTTPAVSFGLVNRYGAMFGLDSAEQSLEYQTATIDSLGMRHMTMQQVYQGVDVYAATVSVHIVQGGGVIAAVSSNVVPNVEVPSTQPDIAEDSARAVAGAGVHL